MQTEFAAGDLKEGLRTLFSDHPEYAAYFDRLVENNRLYEDKIVSLTDQVERYQKRDQRLGLSFKLHSEHHLVEWLVSNRDYYPYFERDERRSIIRDGGLNHSLIISENVFAMLALIASWDGQGRCDVLYADLPYNTLSTGETGDPFVYNDKRIDVNDPNPHSKWLSFSLVRLHLMRASLRDTGVALIAIGKQELVPLGMLLDRVFGAENRIDLITWAGSIKNDVRFVAGTSDYMYVYAKSKSALADADVKWRAAKPGHDAMIDAAARIWDALDGDLSPEERSAKATDAFRVWFKTPEADEARSYKGNHSYLNIDMEGRVYCTDNLAKPKPTSTSRYDLVHPTTGEPVPMHPNGWRYSPETMQEKLAEGRILFGKDHTTTPRYKRYLSDVGETVFRDIVTASRDAATDEIASMLGKRPDGSNWFNGPKNREVIEKWVDYVTPASRKEEARSGGDPILVIDPFAGSGTTGHAVLALNAREGRGIYRFVLITNNEDPTSKDDGNPQTGVAMDVTSPRLTAALTGEWFDGKEHPSYDGSLHVYSSEIGDVRWAQKRNDGSVDKGAAKHWSTIAAFKHDAHRVLEGGAGDEYSVLISERGELIVTWQDAEAIEDWEFAHVGNVIDDVRLRYSDHDGGVKDLLVYIPTTAISEGMDVDGVKQTAPLWKVIPYPDSYISTYEAVRDALVASTFPKEN